MLFFLQKAFRLGKDYSQEAPVGKALSISRLRSSALWAKEMDPTDLELILLCAEEMREKDSEIPSFDAVEKFCQALFDEVKEILPENATK